MIDNTTPLPAPSKRRFPVWARYTAVGVTALAIGAAMGSGGSADAATPAAKPLPAVTVTAPAPAPIEKTVEVPTIPQVCLDALTQADDINAMASDLATTAGDHMGDDSRLFNQFAGGDMVNVDWYMAKQQTLNDHIADLTVRAQANTYVADATACRAAG